jgi:hypothetical protein
MKSSGLIMRLESRGCLTTQVLLPGDSMVTDCLLELERALYKEIRKG